MSVEPGIVDANVLVYASMRTLPSIWHRVLCSMQGAGHDDALRHLTSALRILFRRHQSPARFKAAYGCRHHSRHNGLTLFLHFLPIPARTVKDGHPVPQPTRHWWRCFRSTACRRDACERSATHLLVQHQRLRRLQRISCCRTIERSSIHSDNPPHPGDVSCATASAIEPCEQQSLSRQLH
jgi:hypothetical protein